MTLCNMSIEAGSRVGMIAPDETTFAYLKGRPLAPNGSQWDRGGRTIGSLAADPTMRVFDREVAFDVSDAGAAGFMGHDAGGECCRSRRSSPIRRRNRIPVRRERMQRSLSYMGLTPGTKLEGIPIDRVFIGSCTNSRIEDLRLAARIASGRTVASNVSAIVVPGSAHVRMPSGGRGPRPHLSGRGLRVAGEPAARCASR